jgi:hypothetical protein
MPPSRYPARAMFVTTAKSSAMTNGVEISRQTRVPRQLSDVAHAERHLAHSPIRRFAVSPTRRFETPRWLG